MYSCTHLLIYSCTHVLMYSCTHLLIYSSTHFLYTNVLMYSYTHVFMYSCTHVLSSSYTHVLLYSCNILKPPIHGPKANVCCYAYIVILKYKFTIIWTLGYTSDWMSAGCICWVFLLTKYKQDLHTLLVVSIDQI